MVSCKCGSTAVAASNAVTFAKFSTFKLCYCQYTAAAASLLLGTHHQNLIYVGSCLQLIDLLYRYGSKNMQQLAPLATANVQTPLAAFCACAVYHCCKTNLECFVQILFY